MSKGMQGLMVSAVLCALCTVVSAADIKAPSAPTAAGSGARPGGLGAPGGSADSGKSAPGGATSQAPPVKNPDNMPIKRPRGDTHDEMAHPVPASGANAR
jgi:hypothetical protein